MREWGIIDQALTGRSAHRRVFGVVRHTALPLHGSVREVGEEKGGDPAEGAGEEPPPPPTKTQYFALFALVLAGAVKSFGVQVTCYKKITQCETPATVTTYFPPCLL